MKLNLKSMVKAGAKGARSFTIKNGPTISVVFGITMMAKAGLKAVRKAPIVNNKIEERKKELHVEKLPLVETAKIAAPYYGPPIAMFTIGSGCVLGGHYVSTKRAAMATAAYSMIEEVHNEYVEATKTVVGEKKEAEIRDQVAKSIVEDNPPEVQQQVIVTTGRGKRVCLDVLSQTYFWNDQDTIKDAVSGINKRLKYEDYIPLEDYYYAIDLREGPYIELAKDIGFHSEDGDVELHFTWINGTGQYQDMPILAVGFLTNPVHRKDTWR